MGFGSINGNAKCKGRWGPGVGWLAGTGVPGSGARCVANVAVWYLLLRGFPSTNPLLRGRQNRRVVSENLNKENLVCAVCLYLLSAVVL